MFQRQRTARPTLTGTGIPFDPRNFGDPVAAQTEWIPMISGGNNFRTRKLVETSQGYAFKPTLGALFFGLVFFVLGVAALAFCVLCLVLSQSLNTGGLGVLLFGLLGTGTGVAIWYHFGSPIIFDNERGFFWKGRLGKDGAVDQLEIYAPLKQIHALQLISESCRSTSTDNDGDSRTEYYYSFELNLVDHRGQRTNVVDHGNYKALRADADTLAAFLDVPVWDACG